MPGEKREVGRVGTGSVSCNSAFVLHLCRFLNQEELMEGEAMVQHPSSHCRDLPCRQMHPHKIMHNPVAIPSFLQACCVLGIPSGLPPLGRTPASQRRMEGCAMIRMPSLGGHRLYRVGMLWRGGVICRPFGPALMSLRPLLLQPPFDPAAPRFLWAPPLTSP